MRNTVVNGYFTQVPNAILETLSKHTLPAYETRLLNRILRETVGRHRVGFYTRLRELGKQCAMDYRHVGRALKALEARRVIARRYAKRNTHIELNLNVFEWVLKEPPGLFTQKSMSQAEVNAIAKDANALSPEEATKTVACEYPMSPVEVTNSVASGGDENRKDLEEIAKITRPFHRRFDHE